MCIPNCKSCTATECTACTEGFLLIGGTCVGLVSAWTTVRGGTFEASQGNTRLRLKTEGDATCWGPNPDGRDDEATATLMVRRAVAGTVQQEGLLGRSGD